MRTTMINFQAFREKWRMAQSAKVLSLLLITATIFSPSCKKDKANEPTGSSADQAVSTLAGSTAGFKDDTGASAQFYLPAGVTVDKDGYVYVADTYNHRIRKISPEGLVSTLAGSGTAGFKDDTGEGALFNLPMGIATDTQGNLYVADTYNHRIRKINPQGVVSTLAGSTIGFNDDTGEAALFYLPMGVAADAQANVYVADAGNHSIRKINFNDGKVSTLAGNVIAGFKDDTGTAALFNFPTGVATDAQNNLYVADNYNNKIRKISPEGMVSTLAGKSKGFAEGKGETVKFNVPSAVAVDAEGNVYIGDADNDRIRKITAAGVVSTLAGRYRGFAEGTRATAKFNRPWGIAVDAQGKVYVADTNNNRIRKIQQ